MDNCKAILSVTVILITTAPLLQAQRQLRVNIYPWIPDLADDKLQTLISWIETTFEVENPEIDLVVSSPDFDIYDLDDLNDHLTSAATAPHIVEIDTILLGEIVDDGLIAQINPATYGLNTPGAYLPSALEAVQYNENYYAVPTFICGAYLVGVNVGDITQTCPIQNGVTDYSNLNSTLNQCKQDLLIPPRTLTLAGNFKGSWTLPNTYIDAYIDRYGANTVYDAIDSVIADETDVIDDMRSFIEYCQVGNNNKCFDGTLKDATALVKAVVDNRETITGYSYSEVIGAYLQHAINQGIDDIDVYNVIAPPLGPGNNFLMYTDAMVINRALVTTTAVQEDVDAFMNFYSRLTTRLSIAFGDDLPVPHPPRYLMQARMDFYTAQQVTANAIYSNLNTTLQYAVAAPNNRLYNNRVNMNNQITQALDITVGSLRSFNQCKLVSLVHPRYRNESLEEFVDFLQEINGSFNTKYWEVLPEATSDPLCALLSSSAAAYMNTVYSFFVVMILYILIIII